MLDNLFCLDNTLGNLRKCNENEVSLLLVLIWSIIKRYNSNAREKDWIGILEVYFLAIMLFIYYFEIRSLIFCFHSNNKLNSNFVHIFRKEGYGGN